MRISRARRRFAVAMLIGLVQSAKADVWRDAATGQPVASGPILPTRVGLLGEPGPHQGILPTVADPSRAFDPETGRNCVRVKSDCTPKRTAVSPPPASPSTPEVGMIVEPRIGGGLGGA